MFFTTDTLADVFRGDSLESRHAGAIAVVNAEGRVVAHVGDPNLVTFVRSSAKPFQLMPLVESGAADRFHFTDEELAVMAASHRGLRIHLDAVSSILQKIGLTPQHLQCGLPHKSIPGPDASSPVSNNCSGKHAGFLAKAVDEGLPTDNYLSPEHPIQRAVLKTIADVSGAPENTIRTAIDGCSAPTFSMPLANLARAFVNLAAAKSDGKSNPSAPTERNLVGSGISWSRPNAMARIQKAMTDHPEMISGEGGFDTELMKLVPNLVSKGGAEGIQAIGIGGKSPLGIAIKIADGAARAAAPVAIEVLDQLGLLTSAFRESLKTFREPIIKNQRGFETGRIKTNFQLKRI